MKFLKKRNFIITGVSVIMALVMVLSGVQVGRTIEQKGSLTIGQGFPTIRIGMAGVAAAGTADYTCTGTNDDVIVQAALNSLPSNGGRLEFLAGNYSFSATVSRVIPNVTIQGVGKATSFSFDGAQPIFQPGGNNWVFKDMAFDSLNGINQGVTTGWIEENIWLGTLHYTFRSTDGETVAGSFTSTNITGTQVNGVTGNVSQNVTTANLTVSSNATIPYLAVSNITARDATVIVATSGATPAEKAIANFVLPGVNDEVTLINAFNTLPNHGSPSVGTKTGTFRVIGGGAVSLGALLDFPPMQDIKIEIESPIFGAGIRFDSTMNALVEMGLSAGTTNNTGVIFYPRTVSTDNIVAFNANNFHFMSVVGGGTVGISFNESVVGFFGNRVEVDEGLNTFSTPIDIATADIPRNLIIVDKNPNVFLLAPTQNITSALTANVTFTSETVDTWSMHDNTAGNNTKITFLIPGTYVFGAGIQWDANSTGSRELSIRYNTSTVLCETRTLPDGSLFTYQSISGIYTVNAGDFIEVFAIQRSGGSLQIIGGSPAGGSFWAYKLN